MPMSTSIGYTYQRGGYRDGTKKRRVEVQTRVRRENSFLLELATNTGGYKTSHEDLI